MDQAFYEQVFENARRLWFDPEIERRVQAGQMKPDTKVWGAQVLMEVGQPLKVNLNGEVCGVFKLKRTEDKPMLTPGQALSMGELSQYEIQGMSLTQAEANCGHLTVLLLGGANFLTFDFRYNAGRIQQLMVRAQEFLSAATGALRSKRYTAFVENLFAAVELLAKATLMSHPDERVLRSTRHEFVRTEINRYRKHGNIPEPFVRVLNELTDLRGPARYGDTPFALDHAAARRMSRAARRFFKHVDLTRPRRYSDARGNAA